jgi:hypothetical protein
VELFFFAIPMHDVLGGVDAPDDQAHTLRVLSVRDGLVHTGRLAVRDPLFSESVVC